MKRIGIFAGTFDPIHVGHVEVARSSVQHLELDELHFMVEAVPWSNKDPVSVEHRQNMVDLAISDDEKIKQSRDQMLQFSIRETLPKIEAKFPDSELYFVFGGDVFLHMNTNNWQELDKLLIHHIVVFERVGISNQSIEQHAKKLGIVVATIPSVHAAHASSDVRLSLRKNSNYISDSVASYITKYRLYS